MICIRFWSICIRFCSICVNNILFFNRSEIGESANKYQLLGLNLLFLLSQNRVSEFHTELELLPQEIIQTNEFIRHPLALEQYFMEGCYNKIFRAKVQQSHKFKQSNYFSFFISSSYLFIC